DHLRHHSLPGGGRLLRPGVLHRRGPADRGRAARGAPPPLLTRLPGGGGAAAGRAGRGRGAARRRGDAHRSRPRARRRAARRARPRRARTPGSGPPRGARVDRAAGDDGRLPARVGRGGGGAMSWRRLRTLVVREVRATLRDPFTMTILITVPLVALVLFGFVLATDVKHLALGVHDASGTAASRRLIADLGASGTFDPRPYATRAALERALVAGTISAALVIPPDFDRDLNGGEPPQVQVIYDGGEAPLAGNAEAFIRSLLARSGASLAPPVAPPAAAPPGGVEVVTRSSSSPSPRATSSSRSPSASTSRPPRARPPRRCRRPCCSASRSCSSRASRSRPATCRSSSVGSPRPSPRRTTSV